MPDFASLDHVLIFFTIFVSLLLLFRATLSAVSVLGALAAACVFIAADGHFLLAELTLPRDRNPQIATVALFAFTTAALIITATVKRFRTFDRLLIAIAAASVLATGALFHTILIATVLPAWSKDAAWGNSYLLKEPAELFLEKCEQSRLQCWSGAPLNVALINDSFRNQVKGIYEFYQDNDPGAEAGHGFGAFNDLHSEGVSVVLYHQDGNDVRVIADARTGVRIHSTVRDSFYLLSTVAHGVWLIGALSLIGFHRSRFKRRAS